MAENDGSKLTESEKKQRNEATLFIGNLPVNTKRVQIIRLLKDFEPVKSIRFRTAGGKVIFKHKARKEAGSLNAYVLLKDAETVKKALSLNGSEFKGRHLRLTRSELALDKLNQEDTKRMIFVGNLKYSANEEKLIEIFSNCGEIEYARCLRDGGEKGCKGVAYVSFKSADAVGLALELNGTILDERPIHVERYSINRIKSKHERAILNEQKKTQGRKTTEAKNHYKRKNKDNKKAGGPAEANKPKTKEKSTGPTNQKKSDYRGMKVNKTIKKRKNKKSTNNMNFLAKKIAPRQNV